MLRLFTMALFSVFLIVSSGFAESERTVVLFGDSTTAVRGKLKIYAHHLSEAKFSVGEVKIINAGVGGHNTDHASARFEKDVREPNPEVVVIQFGINDAAIDVWKRPPATKSRVALDDYRANLRSFVRILRNDGTTVILMTPNPLRWNKKMREMYGKPPYDPEAENGLEAPLLPYVATLRELADEEKIPLIDVHRLFHDYGKVEGQLIDDLLLDGVHPNAAGHRLVAEALLPVLQNALSETALSKPPLATHRDHAVTPPAPRRIGP